MPAQAAVRKRSVMWGHSHRCQLKRVQGEMPLENPFSFSLGSEGSKREREKKRFLGTPQTPAGGPLHPLGRGIALKLTPMGDTHCTPPRGDCPLEPRLS